jgi:hypothetical protein
VKSGKKQNDNKPKAPKDVGYDVKGKPDGKKPKPKLPD